MKTATLTKYYACAVATASSLLTLGLFTPAFAGPERLADNSQEKVQMVEPTADPKWYVSVGVGTDIDTGATDFSNGFRQVFSATAGIGLASAFPDVFGAVSGSTAGFGTFQGAELNIRSRDWTDAYSNFVRARAEFGRRICSCFEVFGSFEYTHADAETLTGSHLELFFTGGSFDIPFVSRFSDYNAFGGELGFRWYPVLRDSPIRPYLTLSAGATYVDSISLSTWTNIIGQNITIFNDKLFYDESIVGTGTALLGLESRVTRCFSVGVDAGLRYQTTLCPATLFDISSSGATSGPGTSISSTIAGLNSLNHDAGDRLVVPVTFWAKLKF